MGKSLAGKDKALICEQGIWLSLLGKIVFIGT
jgi:hypothetical protein